MRVHQEGVCGGDDGVGVSGVWDEEELLRVSGDDEERGWGMDDEERGWGK